MAGLCMLKKWTMGHESYISVKPLPRKRKHLKAKLAVFVRNPKVTSPSTYRIRKDRAHDS